MTIRDILKDSPTISLFVDAVLKIDPDHQAYLEKSLGTHTPEVIRVLEELAGYAKRIILDRLPIFAADYIWMCREFKEEQLYFHRHGEYRLKTLLEAKEKVYDNHEYMGRYINGILLSQFLWGNHATSFSLFKTEFLEKNPKNYVHLDIGSGHGLFLVLAAEDKKCGQLNAWDISQSSLAATTKALKQMDISIDLNIREQDLLDNSGVYDQFDSVICSEVLEHTENPEKGLKHIYQILKPGGRAYINVPINSPAPDHIYLWRKTEEVRNLFINCGFQVESFYELPVSGVTVERAKKFNFDISCVGILRKPE